jgi:hypothetical protein
LEAAVHSELFALEATRFQELMTEEPRAAALCKRYAMGFELHAKQCQAQLTDITIDWEALGTLVSSAWEGLPDAMPKSHNSGADVARLMLSQELEGDRLGSKESDQSIEDVAYADIALTLSYRN